MVQRLSVADWAGIEQSCGNGLAGVPTRDLEIALDPAARTVISRTPSDIGIATYRAVFGVTEFRALWLAQLLSVAGDQLARVAMTVLVYDHTHSALWTALTYAVTFLPWAIGGLALSGLADRLPRRRVMVACDLARFVLMCLMALVSLEVPPTPALWIMVTLLFAVTLLDSPFKAARSATLPDVLPGERYILGIAVTQTTIQIGMAAGFALGGVIVAVTGVRTALLADAATFAASAALAWVWVQPRSAAVSRLAGGPSRLAEVAAAVRLVFGARGLRTLMLLGWLVAFYIVPTGLAAPYAASLRASLPVAVSTGLIFAACPFGTAVGAVIFGRAVPAARRQRLMAPLAVAACGLLPLCWLRPGMVASLAILAGSGACASYQLAANAAFVSAVPPARRGQAFGLANGGMQVSQGLWIVLAGAVVTSNAVSPGAAIASSGGIGAILAAALAISGSREPSSAIVGR